MKIDLARPTTDLADSEHPFSSLATHSSTDALPSRWSEILLISFLQETQGGPSDLGLG